MKLGPNESSKEKIHVEADEYLDKLVDQTAFKVFVLGHVDVSFLKKYVVISSQTSV